MKRILSVILSLALLASLLIIPMSTSALDSDPCADLIKAVDDLQLNPQNATMLEVAKPAASQVRPSAGGWNVTTEAITVLTEELAPELGSKAISVNQNAKSEAAAWFVKTDTLNTLRYSYDGATATQRGFMLARDMGYLVLYVKTASAFKMGLGLHNNAQTPRVFTGLDVAATDGEYVPVVFDMMSIDWSSTTSGVNKMYAGADKLWGYFPVIEKMVDGGDIDAADGIVFGSMFYVPVDEAVRNFKFTIDTAAATVSKNFTDDTALSAEMIATAEAINNDGRYTDESFQALQDAISAAREEFLKVESNLLALAKAEAANLKETEILWSPQYVRTADSSKYAPIADFSQSQENNLTDKEKEFLGNGDNGAYVSVNGTDHYILSMNAPGATSSNHESAIKIGDYSSIKLRYVNKTKDIITLDRFRTLSSELEMTSTDANDIDAVKILSGMHEFELLNNKKVQGVLGNANFAISRGQVWLPSGCGQLVVGSLIGEKKFDTSAIDALTTNAQLVEYYQNNIAGKGYENDAAITATINIIGVPPVITGVEEGGNYCGSVELTFTDADLAKVENGNDDITSSLTGNKLTISEAGTYAIVATDAKGNTATVNFTVTAHSLKYTGKDNVITEACDNCDHEETLTIKKTTTDAIVYDGNDKADKITVDKTDGFIAFEGGIDFQIGGVQAQSVTNAGNYTAIVTILDETSAESKPLATATLDFTIEKATPVYTVPTGLFGEAGNELSTVSLEEGFIWKNPTEKIKYSTTQEYDIVYTPSDVTNYNIVDFKVKVEGRDTIAPTGKITIKQNFWDKVTNVVFGWFIKDKETVTIEGADSGSGIANVFYKVADAEITDTSAITDWTQYSASFKIEKEGNNVVYAKIVDLAGNETIINSDGIVLDTTKPSADVEDKGTYYGALTVTVSEAIEKVTVDGKEVTVTDGKFTVAPAAAAQLINITDKAGNEAAYTVTVIEVKGLDAETAALGERIILTVETDEKNIDDGDVEKVSKELKKGETAFYFDISLNKLSGGKISNTTNVLEVPVDFNFTGKLDIRVLHNHGGEVKELKALTAKPTANFEDGAFFADKENGKLYIYSNKFSVFAVAYHVHDLKHVEAKAATAEADGNIEYWYCEGCDKYFSDANATKEIKQEDTVVKYVAPQGGVSEGVAAPATPEATSPVTGQTALTVVLFAMLLGALAVMGIVTVKSRKAKASKH